MDDALIQQLASLFARLDPVTAIALGGSQSIGMMDTASDIDLYIFTTSEIPLDARWAIMNATGGATKANLGMQYWGPGDEWYHAPSGMEVDIIYFDSRWMVEQIHRVVKEYQANLGYTTCFWYTIQKSKALFDRQNWLAELKNTCQQEYPETLQRNIVALNHPVLRSIIPSYLTQIKKAVRRRDLISVNHRLAALFASYFDILFAVNRQLHPGEKRLVEMAYARCEKRPEDMGIDITAVLNAAGGMETDLIDRLEILFDHLDELLCNEGLEIPDLTGYTPISATT
jgi:hypothetical protein